MERPADDEAVGLLANQQPDDFDKEFGNGSNKLNQEGAAGGDGDAKMKIVGGDHGNGAEKAEGGLVNDYLDSSMGFWDDLKKRIM